MQQNLKEKIDKLIRQVEEEGGAVWLENGRLRCRLPANKAALAELLVGHRQELLWALQGRCPTCGGGVWVVYPGGQTECLHCHPVPEEILRGLDRLAARARAQAETPAADSLEACHNCGGTTWWRRNSRSPWLCHGCRPPYPWLGPVEVVQAGRGASMTRRWQWLADEERIAISSGQEQTCADCPHWQSPPGSPNPQQAWGTCSLTSRGRWGIARACNREA